MLASRRKLMGSIPIEPDERDGDVLAAWIAGVDRRIDELGSGKVETIPAEAVSERLRRSLRG